MMAGVYRVVITRTMYVWAKDAEDAAKVANHWGDERNPAEEQVNVVRATYRTAANDDWLGCELYNSPAGLTVEAALRRALESGET